MRRIILLSFSLMLSIFASAQDIQTFVQKQIETYPKSRLLDIYKSCFQDYMGAEHLVSDRQIRAIKEGLIKEDMLLDAFIRSANTSERPSVESWRDRWHVIIGTIDQMQLQLPNFDKDKQFIESILSAGKYAISHSPEYREAYHPHYRIVEKGIFEREIKPWITGLSL